MAIRVIPGTARKRTHLIHLDTLDLARTIIMHRSAVWGSISDFGINVGTAILNVTAARASVPYNFDADEFYYRALDGRLIVMNEGAFSGAITDSGEGPGVTVAHVKDDGKFPSTAHYGDEES